MPERHRAGRPAWPEPRAVESSSHARTGRGDPPCPHGPPGSSAASRPLQPPPRACPSRPRRFQPPASAPGGLRDAGGRISRVEKCRGSSHWKWANGMALEATEPLKRPPRLAGGERGLLILPFLPCSDHLSRGSRGRQIPRNEGNRSPCAAPSLHPLHPLSGRRRLLVKSSLVLLSYKLLGYTRLLCYMGHVQGF